MVSGVIWSKASPWPNVQSSSLPFARKFGKAQRPMAHRNRGLLFAALTSPDPEAVWLKSISKYADVFAPRVSGPCIARFSRVRLTKARNTSRLALFPPPRRRRVGHERPADRLADRGVVMLDVQPQRAAQPDLEVLGRVDVAGDVLPQERRRAVVGLPGAGLQVEEV